MLVHITLVQDTPTVLRISQFYNKATAGVWNPEAWSDEGEKARHRGLASALLFALVLDFSGPYTTKVILSASGEFPGAFDRLKAVAAKLTGSDLRNSIPHAPPRLLALLPTLSMQELRVAWVDHHRNYEMVQFYERAFGFRIVCSVELFDVEMEASFSTFLSNAVKRHARALQDHLRSLLPEDEQKVDTLDPICAITRRVMAVPLLLACGHAFERHAIELWKAGCPLCRTPFNLEEARPHLDLARVVGKTHTVITVLDSRDQSECQAAILIGTTVAEFCQDYGCSSIVAEGKILSGMQQMPVRVITLSYCAAPTRFTVNSLWTGKTYEFDQQAYTKVYYLMAELEILDHMPMHKMNLQAGCRCLRPEDDLIWLPNLVITLYTNHPSMIMEDEK
jgi:hypothetical protein